MEKKTKWGRWIFIAIILAILGLISMIVAGIISVFLNIDSVDLPVGTGNVAVIKIDGQIFSSKPVSIFYEGAVSTKIVDYIKKASEDDSINAILIEINSPGGSPVGSEEIKDAIAESEKFTVALIREVAASGGYWAASAADIIVASKMSITGSVGVLSSYLEFSGLMDKYGISYERLVGGKYKDIGNPFTELGKDEKSILQKSIDAMHKDFLDDVADNRGLSEASVKKISTGMFFIGDEAKELGLIDTFGNKDDAVEIIEKKFNITAKLVDYREKRGFADIFAEMISGQSYKVGQGIGNSLFENRFIIST